MTSSKVCSGVIYWFRNDLRLHDNPALQQAIALAKQRSTWLLPVYVHDTGLQLTSPWGFVRTSAHRLAGARQHPASPGGGRACSRQGSTRCALVRLRLRRGCVAQFAAMAAGVGGGSDDRD
ncbi:deoxyribodipyrimidine photo-lyase [Limnohabitans sp. 63ED37-2]|uniref:deoxyribodipyrimidine photo-lyase n=1 Tax=Limnohabitans sp. 63ED37-2 TaxID=1678128 RepID=UPI001E3C914B|nr:deoxyribodipyrimidine photo-lyase [Limnohabitans sp. 63ED37-2]